MNCNRVSTSWAQCSPVLLMDNADVSPFSLCDPCRRPRRSWISWIAWLSAIQASARTPLSFWSTLSWRSAPMQPLWLNWLEALVEAWGSYSSRGLVYVAFIYVWRTFFCVQCFYFEFGLCKCNVEVEFGSKMADSADASQSSDTIGKSDRCVFVTSVLCCNSALDTQGPCWSSGLSISKANCTVCRFY